MHLCKIKTIIEVFLIQDMLNKVVSRTIENDKYFTTLSIQVTIL